MNPDQVAAYFDSAIRVLYNSSKLQFDEIFGVKNGSYLWHKFTVAHNANEGSFICYLDHTNQRLLAEAVIKFAQKEDYRVRDEARETNETSARD